MAQIIVIVLLLLAAAPAWADPPVAKINHRKYKGGDLHEACSTPNTVEVCDGIVIWKNGTMQEVHNGKAGKFLPTKYPREGKPRTPPDTEVVGIMPPDGHAAGADAPMAPLVVPDTSPAVIDTYILISPQQVVAWGGITSATNKAQLAVDKMNEAFTHSGINAVTRAVGIVQDSKAELSTMDLNLSDLHLRYTSGEFTAIEAATGFDQITKLVVTSSGGVGLGYLYCCSRFAQTIVNGNASTANITFAHEMGHNMGLCHNWQGLPLCTPNGPGCNVTTAYGYGASSKFRTVMSYGGGPRTPQWSEIPPAKWFSDGTSAVGNANADATACLKLTAPLLASFHALVIPISTTNPHTTPTALTWTSGGVLSGSTVAGTLTWTHARPVDLAKYVESVDGAPVTNLGLPALNSVPLALTLGAHTVTLSACYTDLTCLPTSTSPTVTVNTPLAYTSLTPADNASFTRAVSGSTGVPIRVTVTDNSGISYARVNWVGPTGSKFTWPMTHVGNDYSYNVITTAGAGTRTWYIEIKAVDLEIVKTPVRTVVIIP